MKILVLSDIHANIFALDAVLKDAPSCDAIWFLGDLVGYGANPVETYEKMKQAFGDHDRYSVWLAGNHERILKKEDTERFSNSEQVDRRHFEEVLGFKMDAETDFSSILLEEANVRKGVCVSDWVFFPTHSSYADPNDDYRYLYPWLEYPGYAKEFRDEFDSLPGNPLQSRCLLYGHTHVPTLVRAQQKANGDVDLEATRILPFATYALDKGCSWFINPGSVGLPSDKDPRASYVVIDLSSEDIAVTFYRVDYSINDALRAMSMQGYDFLEVIQNYRDRLINATPHPNTPPTWLEHYDEAKHVKRKTVEL